MPLQTAFTHHPIVSYCVYDTIGWWVGLVSCGFHTISAWYLVSKFKEFFSFAWVTNTVCRNCCTDVLAGRRSSVTDNIKKLR